jgi:putative acetyltransferase
VNPQQYPPVLDPERVGSYPARVFAGGGFVWDAVLEYRVWLHPERGAPDVFEGSDYFYAFENYEEALAFSTDTTGAEEPLALILQREFIDESQPGVYKHVAEERITEWPVEFLNRPQRAADTIPNFLAPDAPPNRLDILRGFADLRQERSG